MAKIAWQRLSADLVVIVLGVLIALAADQRRGSWVEAREEQEVLTRLLEEARAFESRDDFGAVLEGIHAGRAILAYAQGTSDSLPRPVAALTAVRSAPMLYVATQTYDGLLATGQLDVISDDDVRGSVVGHFGIRRGQLEAARKPAEGDALNAWLAEHLPEDSWTKIFLPSMNVLAPEPFLPTAAPDTLAILEALRRPGLESVLRQQIAALDKYGGFVYAFEIQRDILVKRLEDALEQSGDGGGH